MSAVPESFKKKSARQAELAAKAAADAAKAAKVRQPALFHLLCCLCFMNLFLTVAF